MNKMIKRKYRKLLVKLAEEIPWNIICVDLGPYVIRRKGKKENLYQNAVTIDPEKGRSEVVQYDDKRAITRK